VAFTDTQRAQIRLYLGWPARFWQMNSRLEQAMNAVESQAEEVTICTDLLTALVAHDARVTACYSRLKAMKVGSIELTGHGELLALRSEGRRLSGRLAATLAVDVQHDVWAGSGPKQFASSDGWQSGSDNTVRQG
jgi:hypothetical protein